MSLRFFESEIAACAIEIFGKMYYCQVHLRELKGPSFWKNSFFGKKLQKICPLDLIFESRLVKKELSSCSAGFTFKIICNNKFKNAYQRDIVNNVYSTYCLTLCDFMFVVVEVSGSQRRRQCTR